MRSAKGSCPFGGVRRRLGLFRSVLVVGKCLATRGDRTRPNASDDERRSPKEGEGEAPATVSSQAWAFAGVVLSDPPTERHVKEPGAPKRRTAVAFQQLLII